MMKFLPACFFPTKVLLIDDDARFLKELSQTIDKQTATFETFSNPHTALSSIENIHKAGSYFDKWLSDGYYKIKTDDYSHCHQIYQAERFNQISTIVSDYTMPAMNGLEFFSQIPDSYVRKIILTGDADESTAVQAFNQGLIHGFIRKNDPKALNTLMEMIRKSQLEFFQSLTRGALESAKQDEVETVLQFPGFIEIFETVLKQANIVEYYLLDATGKFLLIDADGNFSAIFAYNEDEQKIYNSYLEAEAYFFNDQEFTFPKTPAALPAFLKGKESVDRVNGRKEAPHHDFPVYEIPGQEKFVWGYIPKLINSKGITSFNSYKQTPK